MSSETPKLSDHAESSVVDSDSSEFELVVGPRTKPQRSEVARMWGGFYCCVPHCRNSTQRNKKKKCLGLSHVSFHKFPTEDEALRKAWTTRIIRDEGPSFKITSATKVSHRVWFPVSWFCKSFPHHQKLYKSVNVNITYFTEVSQLKSTRTLHASFVSNRGQHTLRVFSNSVSLQMHVVQPRRHQIRNKWLAS